MRNIALLCVLTFCLSSCIGFGSGVISPLFQANFRAGSSFPQLDPFDNVLLIDVSDSVDHLAVPPTLTLRIDGTTVHTQPVSQGGRIELAFPPAAWAEVDGEHELEIQLGDIERFLPFAWND
jgi:hypothetical protein